MSETRSLHPLQMRAAVQRNTLNEEARTVEFVLSTGARVPRGFWEPHWEELSLDPAHVRLGRLNNGAPFLADHNSYSVMGTHGVFERAWLEGDKLVGKVRFRPKGRDADTDKLFDDIRDGIVQNVSVGYRTYKTERVEDGRDREDKMPVYRAVDWEPYEGSAVTIGADDGAGVRSAPGAGEPNPCEIITRGPGPQKEQNVDNEEKTSPAQPTSGPSVDEVRAAAAKAERERATAIRALVKKHQLGEELAQRLVDQEVPLEQARATLLEELFKRSQGEGPGDAPSGVVERGVEERDKRVRGMTAWLLERSGMADTVRNAAKHERWGARFQGVALDGGEFRGLSLLEMARDFLRRNGVETRGMAPLEVAGRAFTFRSGGYQGTSDFAVALENAMHKILDAAYATAPDTWRLFCRADTVSDFRPHPRYRPSEFGVLETVNENGEFKNITMPDASKLSITTGTKGKIVAITRQAIINDDMGFFANVAAAFGRAAGLSIEEDVYALLALNSGLGPTQTDSQPFFHSGRANVNGTGSALTVAGLDADRVVMAQQKDPADKRYLNLRPAVLLVPVGLGGEARVINAAEFDTDPVTTNATNKFQKPNKVRGLFRTIVDTPYLTGTRRYLFVDPSQVAAMVVAFLEGQGEAPVMESMDGWRVDGTEWKLRLDYKAQMFDPKGAVTNAGA